MSEHSQKTSRSHKQYQGNEAVSLESNSAIKTSNCYPVNISILSAILYSQTNVENLIKSYSFHIQHDFPHNSISFVNKLLDININLGIGGQHSCSYNLLFSNEQLGNLTLTRNERFNNDELKRFEDLLSVLFNPLGNAIYN